MIPPACQSRRTLHRKDSERGCLAMPQHPFPARANDSKVATPSKIHLSLPVRGPRMTGEKETLTGEVMAPSIITLHNVTNRAVGQHLIHRHFTLPSALPSAHEYFLPSRPPCSLGSSYIISFERPCTNTNRIFNTLYHYQHCLATFSHF